MEVSQRALRVGSMVDTLANTDVVEGWAAW